MDGVKVSISNRQKAVKVPTGIRLLVRRCCSAVLTMEKFEGAAEVSVSFVDNEQIRQLNREFRDKDAATDVLSFPLGENGVYDYNNETGAYMLGDIVKVKDGYGRNFLIPQGHAKRATKQAIAEFEARRAELEKAQAARVAAAEELAGKLNGAEVTIASKCGVDGRLFGSVTNADIAEAVDKLGFQIKKSQVRTPLGAIKATGEYVITIGLMTDISADVTVKVVAEE